MAEHFVSKETRVNLMDTPKDTIIKMSDGNPGGLNVMLDIIENGLDIDGNNAFNKQARCGYGTLLLLDTYNIYGSDIWVLYKDMCGQNLVKTIAVLRMMQTGMKPTGWVKDLIEEIQGRSPNFKGYPLDKVRAFRKELVEALPELREKLTEFTKDDGVDQFLLPEERKAAGETS